jgi:hypothetical protein
MRAKNKNLKLYLVLIMTLVVVFSPMLSVEANVKYINEELKVDFSDAYIQSGYFYLPLEEEAFHNMFRMVNYPGYIDKASNNFIALGTRHLSQDDWYSKMMIKIPLNTTQKLVMFNNIMVFSSGNDFAPEFFKVPVQLNGKDVTIDVIFDGAVGKIDLIADEKDNKITLKTGDVIKPIYRRFITNDQSEDIVMEDKKIVYNGSLRISQNYYTSDNYAFKVFAQTNGIDGHCESEVIVPKTFISANPAPNNINTNSKGNTSSPSTWAKADIDKAIESGLTTERVLKDYQKSITREEFCELAVNLYEKLSGKTIEPVSPNPFKDTDNIAVLKAYKLGIASGTGNGEFSPNKALNREQMSKMFFSTLQLVYPSIGDSAEELSFTDKDKISIWAKQAVKYMFKEKIILGSNNLFNPQQEASREQAIALVYRVFEKFNK